MPYAAGRVFHDADSHVMEPADWLVPFAEGAMKDRLLRRDPPSTRPPVEAPKDKVIEGLIGGPKGRLAYGAYDPGERVRALEELGFASQLVFPTSALRPFRTSSEQEVLYAGARAANRAMAAFCRDPRLLGVAYVPLDDPARALEEAQEASRSAVERSGFPRPRRASALPAILTSIRSGRCSRPRRFRSSCTSALARARCPQPTSTTASRSPLTCMAAARTCASRTMWRCRTRPRC